MTLRILIKELVDHLNYGTETEVVVRVGDNFYTLNDEGCVLVYGTPANIVMHVSETFAERQDRKTDGLWSEVQAKQAKGGEHETPSPPPQEAKPRLIGGGRICDGCHSYCSNRELNANGGLCLDCAAKQAKGGESDG